MRTTLDVDDGLLEELVKVTGEKSKNKAVNKALAEYIRRKKIEELISMFGKIDMIDNLEELEEIELKEIEELEKYRGHS